MMCASTKHTIHHGFKGVQASQGAGGAPQRLGAQGALQGDAFEAALLEKCS
jgi:hypothetical protein